MSENVSNLIAVRPANSPNPFDLRRVGAHPDHWYPVAWSDELKPGRTLGRRFAGGVDLSGGDAAPRTVQLGCDAPPARPSSPSATAKSKAPTTACSTRASPISGAASWTPGSARRAATQPYSLSTLPEKRRG